MVNCGEYRIWIYCVWWWLSFNIQNNFVTQDKQTKSVKLVYCPQKSACSFLKRFEFPAHQRPLRLQRQLLTFTSRTYFCTTVNITFAMREEGQALSLCSCIVFLGSDGGNLPAYSASSLEDIPCSALAPQNAIANRDGREDSHDHAAALILCWMGHREAALELCALTWNLWLYSCLPLPVLRHCTRTARPVLKLPLN